MNGVSVIVPVYNSEKYLKVCLTSLIKQTLKDIEIIVINDGSTDNSEKIIKEFVKKHNTIKYYPLKKNKGLGYVRNLGIEKSTKKYIGFVDSDDYVDPDMFFEMYSQIEKTSSDVCECNFIWEYSDKNKIDEKKEYKINKSMLTHIRVLAPNKIYKKEVLLKNKIRFAEGLKYEDILFTYSLVPFIKSICFINKPFYHYVQRKTSLVNHQTKRVKDIYEVLNEVLYFYKNNGDLYEKYEKELEYVYVKTIFLSSLKRASHIQNKKDRKEVLDEGWKLVYEKYPNFKSNKYFKGKGLKKLYIMKMNKFIYNTVSLIMRFI